MRKPDFFIVGAPKCGTTAMYTYLRQHPEIFMPDRKELHFFGSDFKSKFFIRDEATYLSFFSKAKNEKRIGEASVWYLYSKLAAKEIKDYCPSAKIIIMLRNPVDVLYSQHSQFLYNGNEDIDNFEEALNAEDDRKKGKRIPKGNHFVESLFYKETVKFTQQVKRYLDVFGRENVHIIIYDDFKNETERVYKQTLEFLGVNKEIVPVFEVVNPNKRTVSKLVRNIYINPDNFIRKLGKNFIPKSFRVFLLESLKKLNTKFESRPPMDKELRRRLQKEFTKEIEDLSNLLGRDLTFWVLI